MDFGWASEFAAGPCNWSQAMQAWAPHSSAHAAAQAGNPFPSPHKIHKPTKPTTRWVTMHRGLLPRRRVLGGRFYQSPFMNSPRPRP